MKVTVTRPGVRSDEDGSQPTDLAVAVSMVTNTTRSAAGGVGDGSLIPGADGSPDETIFRLEQLPKAGGPLRARRQRGDHLVCKIRKRFADRVEIFRKVFEVEPEQHLLGGRVVGHHRPARKPTIAPAQAATPATINNQ